MVFPGHAAVTRHGVQLFGKLVRSGLRGVGSQHYNVTTTSSKSGLLAAPEMLRKQQSPALCTECTVSCLSEDVHHGLECKPPVIGQLMGSGLRVPPKPAENGPKYGACNPQKYREHEVGSKPIRTINFEPRNTQIPLSPIHKQHSTDETRMLRWKEYPKGPCTQIVYTLALKYSIYRYLGPKLYSIIWVHEREYEAKGLRDVLASTEATGGTRCRRASPPCSLGHAQGFGFGCGV